MNGVFPVARCWMRRFRHIRRLLPIAPSKLSSRGSVHLPGESPSLLRKLVSYPGYRGLPMLVHRYAWLAQDTHVSGTSWVGFGAHFRRLVTFTDISLQ